MDEEMSRQRDARRRAECAFALAIEWAVMNVTRPGK